MRALRVVLQILVPVAILGGGAWLGAWIRAQRPAPRVESNAFVGPLVRTHVVALEDVRVDVPAQGVVEPFRAIDVAAQVGGRVVAVSPALRAGGFFDAGEVLVEIDRADYELAVVQQEAAVARAELRVLQEKAEAEAALRAWQELEGERPTDPLVRREPQIKDAEAALAAARALLAKSRLDVERTRVTAPFAGRVRSAGVDIGQVVQPGAALARIYGVDRAEVRLPLPVSDAAFLDLPLRWSDGAASADGPSVELVAEFGGSRYTYRGRVLRTEGEIDRKTRQLTVVVGVDDPYARGDRQDHPPLAVGAFVEATIEGRTFPATAALPRAALRGEDEVWIVDAEHRLRRRRVEVLHALGDRIYLRAGLDAGDVVCVTALDSPVEGMPVRLFQELGQ